MNSLLMLVKREYWEHRAGFLYMPLIITAFCSLLMILSLVKFDSFNPSEAHMNTMPIGEEGSDYSMMFNGLSGLDNIPIEHREKMVSTILTGFAAQFLLVLVIMLVLYFMNSLYQDRKDRSILFWKSMPVSDTMTVTSKVIAGLVLAPVIYFVCMMAMHLIVLLISSLFIVGETSSVWAVIWQPANLLSSWLKFFVFLVLIQLWFLPVFSWLLLVSAGAKSAPLAWAAGIPIGLIMLENILTNSSVLTSFIIKHAVPFEMTVRGPGLSQSLGQFMNLEFAISLLLSLAFFIGAIILRRRASDF